MENLKTNTRKRHYHIEVHLEKKIIASFGADTDSVCNALKAAYEQACGWTRTPVQPLEPLEKS